MSMFLGKVISRNIQTNTEMDNQTAVEKAAAFYKACAGIFSGTNDDIENVKNKLLEFGVSWPEEGNTSSLLSTIFSLSAALNWGPILDIRTRHPGNFTAKLSYEYRDALNRRDNMLSEYTPSHHRDYFNLMVNAFKRNVGRLVPYEELTALEEDVVAKIRQPLESTHYTTLKDLSLDDLLTKTRAGVIPKPVWEQTISKRFNITPGTRFAFTIRNVEFFNEFFNLVSSLGEIKMAYYVGWNTVQAFSLLSRKDLVHYYYMTDGEAKLGQQNFCAKLTHKYMGLSFYAGYIRDQLEPAAARDVSVLVRTLRRSLRETLRSAPPPWNRLASVLSAPNTTDTEEGSATLRLFSESTEAHLDELFRHFRDMGSSVISNIEHATKGARLASEDTGIPKFIDTNGARAYYLSDSEFEFLPNAFEVPVYDIDAPSVMKYGALGGEIAEAFTQVLLRAVNTLENDTRLELSSKPPCVYHSDSATVDKVELSVALKTLSVETLFRQFLRASENLRLGLGGRHALTEQQVFFVLLCYTQCGSLGAKDKCNEPLKASKDFSREFACDSSMAMHVGNYCPAASE